MVAEAATGRRAFAVIGAGLMVLALSPALATSHGQETGETTVFTRIGDPGSPEGIYVDDDRVYVGTHTPVFGNSGQGPSHIFVFDKVTGTQIGDMTIDGQTTDEAHGILGMAMDDQGRLYVLDRNPARLLRIALTEDADGRITKASQETYATFPDLSPCGEEVYGTQIDRGAPCSPNTLDQASFPDYLAFTPDGDAYVTDLEQAVIYRVPAGGLPANHDAEVWFADERLDSIFATNGIALGPQGSTLYIAMTGQFQPWVAGTTPVLATQGAIYTLPAQDASPSAGDLGLFHLYPQPAAGPDGVAFGQSGRLYVALAGANQISILSSDGTEIERFPDPAHNQLQEIPYDLPASIAFDDEDRSILVTNQAFFTGNADHWAVLEAYVDDTGLGPIEPVIAS